MAFPTTRLALLHAAGSNFLSAFFGGVTAHSDGENLLIDDLQAVEDTLGVTADGADHLDYVRLHDGIGKGLFVPAGALAGLNPIPNASFDIWADGATYTSVADSTYTADGWVYGKAGAGVHDVLRSTDVPTVAQAQRVNYSLQLDVTTADASIATGDVYYIGARIEGFNWKRFDQQIWSLRFWVKGSKTGVHYVAARNGGTDRTCVIPYSILVADTWEEKQVTFPANPATGTWNFTNGRGIEILWCQAGGATFQTTAGAWQTGGGVCAADQVNELDSTANNFRLALIGPPTLGPNALPHLRGDIALEDLRCKRYNEVFGGNVTNESLGLGAWYGATTAWAVLDMVPKRATPTVVASAAGTFSLLTAAASSVVVTTAPATFLGSSPQKMSVNMTASSATATAGQATALLATNTSAKLSLVSRVP